MRLHAFSASIGGSSLDQEVDLAFRVGLLGAVLPEQPNLAPTGAEAVKAALSDYETLSGVLMPAAVLDRSGPRQPGRLTPCSRRTQILGAPVVTCDGGRGCPGSYGSSAK
jgi:hypothetical protein